MSGRRSPLRRTEDARAARQADEALLIRRLRGLGLRGIRRIVVHRNRTVLVTVTPERVLRIHRGYAYASDRVLAAVKVFAHPRTSRRGRKEAERVLVAFPVERYVAPRTARRRERPRPGDGAIIVRLRRLHEQLNHRHFAGTLDRPRFRLSDRMRKRLGEVVVDLRTRGIAEIAISRRHLAEDGWDEVRHTLLHEMVHQWQVESGTDPDHGPAFRAKAREVGVEPGALRAVRSRRRVARRS